MSFVDERETFARMARITGRVTPDDTRRLVGEGYEGIVLDHESVDAASSLRWIADVPALRIVELRGRIATPSLAALEETSVRSLIVRTNQARPVPTEDLRWATRIHSESSDFAADGWVSLSRLESLVLGRVSGDVITAGDGCSALTHLKLQGKRQTAAFRWRTPPKRLESMLLLALRCRDVAALSGCRALRSIHIENSALLVGGDIVDVSPLADLPVLDSVGIAENLPMAGVPSLLGGEAPFGWLPVAKGHHDGDPADPRLRELVFRTTS